MKVVYEVQVGSFTASYVVGSGVEFGGLVNITGLIQAGENVSISGNGTFAEPYVVSATGGGASEWNALTGTVNVVPFTTSNGGPQNLGELAWDSAEETLSLQLKGGTILQIGEETLYHVENVTGSTITDGTPCSYAGTVGASGKIRVKPWNGSTDQPRAFLGLATGNIATGQTGYVTHFGKVRGIDTSAFSAGAILYANPSGAGLTSTEPTSGNYVIAAVVISSHATNGTLLVRPSTTDASSINASPNTLARRDNEGGAGFRLIRLQFSNNHESWIVQNDELTSDQEMYPPDATGYLALTSRFDGQPEINFQAVKYTELQSLTPAQKGVARANTNSAVGFNFPIVTLSPPTTPATGGSLVADRYNVVFAGITQINLPEVDVDSNPLPDDGPALHVYAGGDVVTIDDAYEFEPGFGANFVRIGGVWYMEYTLEEKPRWGIHALKSETVLLTQNQTVAGQKTFTTSPRSTGTPDADTSLLNRLQGDSRWMFGPAFGMFQRLACVTTAQNSGGGASAGANVVLGLQTQCVAATNSSAGAYIYDNMLSHSGFSGAPMRTDRNIRCWFHGVMLRVEATINWVHRINFGVGNATRTIPAAGVDPATGRQWGVEFYYDGVNYVGRQYWTDINGSTNYGTPFVLSNINGSNWSQLVYSIMMEQTAAGVLNVYINTPTANLGGGLLSTTPISTMNATWTGVAYVGRSINIESATSATNAPTTPVTMRTALQFIEI